MLKKITMGDPAITEEEVAAVAEVLDSGLLVKGPKSKDLEENFAKFVGAKYAIACSSGTDALLLALSAYGVGQGSIVITTPFSFFATASQATRLGAQIFFGDIDPKTFNLCPKSVEGIIERFAGIWDDESESRDEALRLLDFWQDDMKIVILPVHLYGQAADIAAFKAIQDKYPKVPIVILEDACQAHGAKYKSKPVGSFNTACWSLFPSKNLLCGGEGGIVTTNNPKIAREVRLLANHGQIERYKHERIGWNSRLSEVLAAIAGVRLKSLIELNAQRQYIASQYNKMLAGFKGIVLPYVSPGYEHVYHQYTIRVTSDFPLTRDGLAARFKRQNIDTGVHYPIPIHKQPVYEKEYQNLCLPEAEKASHEVLSLPVHPGVADSDIIRVVEVIALAYNEAALS